jgi:hypothetical protein
LVKVVDNGESFHHDGRKSASIVVGAATDREKVHLVVVVVVLVHSPGEKTRLWHGR